MLAQQSIPAKNFFLFHASNTPRSSGVFLGVTPTPKVLDPFQVVLSVQPSISAAPVTGHFCCPSLDISVAHIPGHSVAQVIGHFCCPCHWTFLLPKSLDISVAHIRGHFCCPCHTRRLLSGDYDHKGNRLYILVYMSRSLITE